MPVKPPETSALALISSSGIGGFAPLKVIVPRSIEKRRCPLVPVFFRHVLYARIRHPRGRVDVFTTHLASSSDLASLPCGVNVLPPPFTSPACPAECVAFRDTVRECQARQVALFVEDRHGVPEPAILSGDLNAEPDYR